MAASESQTDVEYRKTRIRMIWTHMSTCKNCRYLNHNIHRCDLLTIEPRRYIPTIKQSQRINQKLNPVYYTHGITTIYAKLRISRMMPTIDCFACRRDAQEAANMYITKQQNFFSRAFDCSDFWSLNVAWAHPPHDMLIQTINTFARRKMRGFLCGPRWSTDLDIFSSKIWVSGKREPKSICD